MLNGLSGFTKSRRYAVFISGSGSTLQSLLEMQHQFDIALVISNKASALGLRKARRFGRNCLVFKNPVDYKTLNDVLHQYRIDRIFLAGYMKRLPAEFVQRWRGRIFNVHPSLLPSYPGLNSAERSFQDHQAMGASIHHVTPEVDEGLVRLRQVSLRPPYHADITWPSAELLLRRTEQHLLREITQRDLPE